MKKVKRFTPTITTMPESITVRRPSNNLPAIHTLAQQLQVAFFPLALWFRC